MRVQSKVQGTKVKGLWFPLRDPRSAIAFPLLLPLVLFVVASLPAAAAPVPIRWDVETSRPASVKLELYRGETVDLEPRLLSYGTALDLTNATSVRLDYLPTGATGDPYTTNGIVHPSEAGRVRVTWSPACEATNALYAYTLWVRTPTGAIARAFGQLKLLGTVSGATTNTPETSPGIVDWAQIEHQNLPSAPFALAGEGGGGVSTGDLAQVAEAVAAVSGRVDQVEAALPGLAGTGTVAQVAADVAAVSGRVDQVEAALPGLAGTGAVAQVAEDVAAVSGRVDQVEISVGSLSGRLDQAEQDITSATGTLAEVSSGLASVSVRVDAVESDLSATQLFLTNSITVTVGPNGDYETMNAAIAYLSNMRPAFDAATNIAATVELQSDYVCSNDQLFVYNQDLSWVTISSSGTIYVASNGLTRVAWEDEGSTICPLFYFNKSRSPAIRATFEANGLFSAEMQNTNAHTAVYAEFSQVDCIGSTFAGFEPPAIYATEFSRIEADSVTVTSSETAPDNLLNTGFFQAGVDSTINAWAATIGEAGLDMTRAVLATSDSSVLLIDAVFGFDSGLVEVLLGGRVTVTGATLGGVGLSQAANTLTADGIIFNDL